MKSTLVYSRAVALALIGACAVIATSCGEVARTGRSPAFLVIDRLEGARGPGFDNFTTTLTSDVQVLVVQQVNGQTVRIPTVYNDIGRATMRLGLKNPGLPAQPLGPSALNEITITRYRVTFKRTDGRNTPGVDVPHGFDGAVTVTVREEQAVQIPFDLVRHQMKFEPPLRNLVGGGSAFLISTIAEVTFWGRDQAGNDVTVTGNISVNFGDFGDDD